MTCDYVGLNHPILTNNIVIHPLIRLKLLAAQSYDSLAYLLARTYTVCIYGCSPTYFHQIYPNVTSAYPD